MEAQRHAIKIIQMKATLKKKALKQHTGRGYVDAGWPTIFS
jgi:hypothetical protein